MKFLGAVGDKLITFWVQIRDLYLYVFRHAIIVNGYVDDHTWCGIRHRNWGDDLNYYFLQELTGRPVVMYHNFKLAKWLRLKNYLCIGTLLDAVNYSNLQTIVWGSGVSGQERTFVHPHKILSVRGPKTKEFCDRYDVQCPEVYGDPALLLPLVYKPPFHECKVPLERVKCKTPKERVNTLISENDDKFTRAEHNYTHDSAVTPSTPRYSLGIIPHVVDLHHPVIEEIREKHSGEILIIDLAHYEKWTDVIDQICSCERILSSSLHGLIVSDAYQVPSCWIIISGNMPGGLFKYFDYIRSVNRISLYPFSICTYNDILSIDLHFFTCANTLIINKIQEKLKIVYPFIRNL